MNWVYMGAYFIDLARFVLAMCGVFGFSLSLSKGCLSGGLFTASGGAVVTLLLHDPSNRIFVFLAAQIIFAVLCLEGEKKVLVEISFLVHFALLTIDGTAQSLMIFILYDDVVLSRTQHVWLNVVSKTITLVMVAIIAGRVTRQCRIKLHKYMEKFNLKLCAYYFICVFSSGIVNAFAGIMAADQVMVYRYKVALYMASGILSIIILVFSVLLHIFFIQRNRLREDDLFKKKCIEEQAAQYALITQKNEQLQRFRHDQQAYVLALKGIIQSGDTRQLYEYVEDIAQKVKAFDYISTGNTVGDAIINAQAEHAEAADITFQVAGRFPEYMRVSDADLAVLLSNAVKNACEAAEQCESPRSVEIMIRSYKKKLFLEIRNTAVSIPVMQKGSLITTKEDKQSHGIGTRNMADIVAKYDGKLLWEYDEAGIVTTKIEI